MEITVLNNVLRECSEILIKNVKNALDYVKLVMLITNVYLVMEIYSYLLENVFKIVLLKPSLLLLNKHVILVMILVKNVKDINIINVKLVLKG